MNVVDVVKLARTGSDIGYDETEQTDLHDSSQSNVSASEAVAQELLRCWQVRRETGQFKLPVRYESCVEFMTFTASEASELSNEVLFFCLELLLNRGDFEDCVFLFEMAHNSLHQHQPSYIEIVLKTSFANRAIGRENEFQRLLDFAIRLTEQGETTFETAKAMQQYAKLLAEHGVVSAVTLADMALLQMQSIGSSIQIAQSEIDIQFVKSSLGIHVEALEHLTNALVCFIELNKPSQIIKCLANGVSLLSFMGQFDLAEEAGRRTIVVAKGHPLTNMPAGFTKLVMGDMLTRKGDFKTALPYIQESVGELHKKQQLGGDYLVAMGVVKWISCVYYLRPQDQIAQVSNAISFFPLDCLSSRIFQDYCFGMLAYMQGEDEKAIELISATLPAIKNSTIRDVALDMLMVLASIHEKEDFERAKACLVEGLEITKQVNLNMFDHRIGYALAELYERHGKVKEAVEYAQEASTRFSQRLSASIRLEQEHRPVFKRWDLAMQRAEQLLQTADS